MADATDFITFLNDHEGAAVMIEVGVPADDLANNSRRLAKYFGQLGQLEPFDDPDRAGRGIAWVSVTPTHQQDGDPLQGFYVEADRIAKTVVNSIGGKVWFLDGQFLSVVIRPE